MIARLEGTLREKTPSALVIDAHGVGYEVFVPLSTFVQLPEEGATLVLRIHTHVREDAIQLFGFATARERALFELLLRTNGIGPRLAQGILSGIEPGALVDALADGDVATLRRIPGLGQKKAERLVVELRERANELRVTLGESSGRGRTPAGFSSHGPAVEQAISALVNLGYTGAEAKRVIELTRPEVESEGDVAALLRGALRRLSQPKGGTE